MKPAFYFIASDLCINLNYVLSIESVEGGFVIEFVNGNGITISKKDYRELVRSMKDRGLAV